MRGSVGRLLTRARARGLGAHCPLWQGWSESTHVSRLGLRFLIGLRFLFGEGADVIYEIPVFFGLDPVAFRRHVLTAFLDNVEEFAVGAAFKTGGVSEVGDLKL